MGANIVVLQGRLTADIDLKTIASGTIIGNFSIAVQHYSKTDKDKVSFIQVTAFNQSAKFISEYAGKGDEVLVTGEIQQQRWENNEGQKREKVVIIARNVNLLRKKNTTVATESQPTDDFIDSPFSDDNVPF